MVLAVWALERRRDVLRPALVLGGFLLAGAGIWFARNWVRTGNPLFPQALPPLFDAPPDPLRELGGFTIAHYLFDGEVWRDYLWPAMRITFGLGGRDARARRRGAAPAAPRGWRSRRSAWWPRTSSRRTARSAPRARRCSPARARATRCPP